MIKCVEIYISEIDRQTSKLTQVLYTISENNIKLEHFKYISMIIIEDVEDDHSVSGESEQVTCK